MQDCIRLSSHILDFIAHRIPCLRRSNIMHSAWEIEDIQFLIFEHLDRRDLVSIARTCKSFFPLATNTIWKTIPSFTPFLSCLPEDSISRKLELEDLERFEVYQFKVKSVLIAGRRTQPVRLPQA
jgi:hypothetical protein